MSRRRTLPDGVDWSDLHDLERDHGLTCHCPPRRVSATDWPRPTVTTDPWAPHYPDSDQEHQS